MENREIIILCPKCRSYMGQMHYKTPSVKCAKCQEEIINPYYKERKDESNNLRPENETQS